MFETETELTAELSRPSPELIARAGNWGDGGLIILGAGGKMGGGVATMARRALDEAGHTGTPVTAVSRWSDLSHRDAIEAAGVRTLEADLSEVSTVDALPDAERVVFLVGAKFGTATHTEDAWMTNTVLPAFVARRYSSSIITALSTGNVYPLSKAVSGGPREGDPTGPVGEYAITCRGREQVFTHGSRQQGTRVALIRLNYACEPRYGVLVDLARQIRAGEPVDLEPGAVNLIWQRYANDVVLQSTDFAATPPFMLNLTGPETASVRTLATELGRRLGVDPIFTGSEQETSLLSNAMLCHELFGYPDRSVGQLIQLVTDWIERGGTLWNKPTKFERRDGQF